MRMIVRLIVDGCIRQSERYSGHIALVDSGSSKAKLERLLPQTLADIERANQSGKQPVVFVMGSGCSTPAGINGQSSSRRPATSRSSHAGRWTPREKNPDKAVALSGRVSG